MRTLAAIDRDLDMERAVLQLERRNGEVTNATLAARARIDKLLEERTASSQHLMQNPAPGVPAHFTP